MTDLTTSWSARASMPSSTWTPGWPGALSAWTTRWTDYNAAIIQELIGVMQQSPDMSKPGLSLFSAIRHLERIADHATNIAEDVVYLVEGEIVRHRLERSEK